MPLLTDRMRTELRDIFASRLDRPVELRLVVSAQATGRDREGCLSCETARELIEDIVAAAPDRLTLSVIDLDADVRDPRAEGVTDTPTLLVAEPGQPGRIRYQGLPSGYEFATVIDAVERVSAADPGIKPANAARLEKLGAPVEIMVFVTPSCPYCPAAATLAQRLALATPNVTAVTVEATEFPELSDRHNVSGVPRIVVNGGGAFVGAMPEDRYVGEVVRLAAAAA
jgi:glutaredoxin-like protein